MIPIMVVLTINYLTAQPAKTPEQSHPVGYPHKTKKIEKPDGTQTIVNPNGGPLPPPLTSPVGSGYLVLLGLGLAYGARKKLSKKD